MVAACNVFVLLLLEVTWSGCAIKHRARGRGKHRDPDEGGPIVNLNDEQRKQKHDQEYLDFEVNISMKRAHKTGLRLGIVFDSFNDWEPPEIVSMRKPSLLEEWNNQHPDQAVYLHDRIVRVNHIQFHHNANAFIERIVGQFKAGRKMLKGASEVMTLQVQRERQQQATTRFAYQREDLHDKLYSKEFNVSLPLPEDETSPKTMYSVMGLELNVTKDWEPVSVGSIVEGGLIAQWNEAHPDDMILVGDEILHVNKRHWLSNTQTFLNHIAFNYEHRAALQPDGAFSLGLRRPRWAQEAYDEAATLRAQADLEKAEAAAKEAKAKAKFEEDMLRVAPDIEDAVNYWNRVFPNDQITATNKSTAEAFKVLRDEGWDYVAAAEPSAPAESENSSGTTDDKDQSEDVIGADGDSALVEPAAAAEPSAAAEAENSSDKTADKDQSQDVIGAEGDSAPEEAAAAAEPSAAAEAENSSGTTADKDQSEDVIGAEGDAAPVEAAAAAEPSAAAEAENSSDTTADKDVLGGPGAEDDAAPVEPAAAAEPSAPAEAEKPSDPAHDEDEAKGVIGAEEGPSGEEDISDQMVLGDEA